MAMSTSKNRYRQVRERRVVEAQEEAEEAHGFDRQSEKDSIILNYRFVRRISIDKRACIEWSRENLGAIRMQ